MSETFGCCPRPKSLPEPSATTERLLLSFLSIFFVGLSVSADAFAASLASGLQMMRLLWGRAFLIAGVFGLFQALMPLLGWALTSRFAGLVEPVDHWIAFGLLGFIGGKMIWEALHPEDENPRAEWMGLKRLLLLGVATSIDAAAVGISMAVLDVPIIQAVAVIGLTTFVIALAGVPIGHSLGARFRTPAEVLGGVLLIALGTKILLEHLGIIA
ncbi:Putative manganese efflux pump [Propionibacterium australiense]|uniref:Putative manganese efflux pump MntP n=1 Tax=Propionibacterium australiense TaxID=119981 RepID=A0A383S4V0_9ACTN|nr:Putative manganese efflux pump [Propionibacterium australiense]